MLIRGYELSARLILTVVGAILLIVAGALFVRSCDKRRSQAAQSRMEASQAQAQSNSAADAINAVAASGRNEAASEDLTRSNERDIRAAQGANDKVNPAVRDAGITALCRRQAYRNDPRCKGAAK
jgi:Flp pilus assembly protein TadB